MSLAFPESFMLGRPPNNKDITYMLHGMPLVAGPLVP